MEQQTKNNKDQKPLTLCENYKLLTNKLFNLQIEQKLQKDLLSKMFHVINEFTNNDKNYNNILIKVLDTFDKSETNKYEYTFIMYVNYKNYEILLQKLTLEIKDNWVLKLFDLNSINLFKHVQHLEFNNTGVTDFNISQEDANFVNNLSYNLKNSVDVNKELSDDEDNSFYNFATSNINKRFKIQHINQSENVEFNLSTQKTLNEGVSYLDTYKPTVYSKILQLLKGLIENAKNNIENLNFHTCNELETLIYKIEQIYIIINYMSPYYIRKGEYAYVYNQLNLLNYNELFKVINQMYSKTIDYLISQTESLKKKLLQSNEFINPEKFKNQLTKQFYNYILIKDEYEKKLSIMDNNINIIENKLVNITNLINYKDHIKKWVTITKETAIPNVFGYRKLADVGMKFVNEILIRLAKGNVDGYINLLQIKDEISGSFLDNDLRDHLKDLSGYHKGIISIDYILNDKKHTNNVLFYSIHSENKWVYTTLGELFRINESSIFTESLQYTYCFCEYYIKHLQQHP